MALSGFGVRYLDNNTKELFEQDEFESGSLYEVKLKDFDGPFDTLCHLIKKSKYSIEDVKISDITQQYMEYMKQIDELDLERATEFITMASWLLEIKSKSLLPKPIELSEDQEDPESVLRQQLAEYSLYKEASKKMKELETVDVLYRSPDKSLEQPNFELKDMDSEALLSALQRVFLKLEQRAQEIRERHIISENFSVEEKIELITSLVDENKHVSFFELFGNDSSKNEIITTFLAMLELLKAQYISVHQTNIFGDIILRKNQPQQNFDGLDS